MFTRGKVAIKVHITLVKLVLRHQHRYRLRNEAGDSKASSWIIPKNVECPVPEGSSLLLGAKLRGEGSEIGVGGGKDHAGLELGQINLLNSDSSHPLM